MKWHIKRFDELGTFTLFNLMKSRVDVFVVEQECAYPELDEIDIAENTLHVYAEVDGVISAYARCYIKQLNISAIGRVLISTEYRGRGLADRLMHTAVEAIRSYHDHEKIEISAQTYLLHFYQKLGFELMGEPYLEDGIEHQDMVLLGH